MTKPLSMFCCKICSATFFPEPLLCSNCHGASFQPREVDHAVVGELSVIHYMAGRADWVPRRIANVKVLGGPELTVGLHGDVEPTDEIDLSLDGTAPFGRPSQGGR
jgi:uncharacterized OB-fold protein